LTNSASFWHTPMQAHNIFRK